MIYLNDIPINVTLFPDNTSQVWKLNPDIFVGTDFFHIRWDFVHEGEFMHLAQLKDLLDAVPSYMTVLDLSYLPYGRQDKPVSNEATFALRSFARALNALGFDEVRCRDPHSKVAGELIKNFKPHYPEVEVNKVLREINATLVCYPDRGAYEKYFHEYSTINKYLKADKVRDQLTGKIIDYKIDCDNLKEENILIVDDICDGGTTFILLANALHDAGAQEVNLFVSHGIFSNGLRPLLEAGIKRIFTPDGEVWPHRAIPNGFIYRRL